MIRVPACARVSRVSRVCPGLPAPPGVFLPVLMSRLPHCSPRCLFTGTYVSRLPGVFLPVLYFTGTVTVSFYRLARTLSMHFARRPMRCARRHSSYAIFWLFVLPVRAEDGSDGHEQSYTAYEARQRSKLGNSTEAFSHAIQRFDSYVESDVRRLLQQHVADVGSPVLCVGARLGGEVKAFQSMPNVDLAIGVDFNPGIRNGWVMWGDAHELSRFKNETFGTVFSNVLDHFLHIPKFVAEARRVLKPNGTLIVYIQDQTLKEDPWAVHDMHKERLEIEGQLAIGFKSVWSDHRLNAYRKRIYDYILRKVPD